MGRQNSQFQAFTQINNTKMKEYKFKIAGKEYTVAVNSVEGKNADVTVNGKNYLVELENAPAAVPAPAAPAASAAPLQTAAPAPTAASAAAHAVKTPLPGVIISIDVKAGQAVKKGQKVAVIEAMKMENDILADADGTIAEILASKGDSVLEGDDILTIA